MVLHRRSVGFLAVILALPVLLANCNGGGGGPKRFYFSMNNYGGCETAYVDLDLELASAVVGRKEDGSVNCALDPELEKLGCTITFEEHGGVTLSATVTDCHIPIVSTLFDCEFEAVDAAGFEFEPSDGCGCLTTDSSCYVNGICDLCASSDADVASCENCDNDLDDDNDGKIDCADTDCELTSECGFGRTTVTCSTNPVFATTTTSNTLPPAAAMMDSVDAQSPQSIRPTESGTGPVPAATQ